LEEMLARVREYPMRLIDRDGTIHDEVVCSMDEAGALRIFDEVFMNLHATRRIYATVPNIIDRDMSYFRREFPDLTRIELHDYLSDVVLAKFDIEYGGSDE
jgi:hypothetical protein